MDLSNYSNTAQQLASLTEAPPPAADVLDDVVNDKARYAKELLEGVGSTLGSHSTLKGIEQLFKTDKAKVVMKKLGVSEEDATKLVAKLKDGDFSGAISDISKGVVKRGTSKVEDAVSGLKSSVGDVKLGNIKLADVADQLPVKHSALTIQNPAFDESIAPERAVGGLLKKSELPFPDKPAQLGTQPLQKFTPAPNVEAEAALGGKAPLIPVEDGGFRIGQPPTKAEPVEQSTKSGIKSVDDNAIKAGEKQGEKLAEKEAVKAGEKELEEGAEKKLAKAAIGSIAEDETGVGLVATGLISISALVAGLLSKDHKKKFIAPPAQAARTNYAVQIGA